MQFERIAALDAIWKEARTQCANTGVFNLLLAYEFAIGLIDSEFVAIHEEKAKQWQSETPAPALPFSHGQYARGEKGIQHVLDELKSKSASRRALLSLVGMDHIIGRGDDPIPSFMILQFAMENDVLYATSYFRALEVRDFFRTNLAEMCLIIRRIRQEFQHLRTVRLLVLAFRAYEDEGFVLERAAIDLQPRGKVAIAVAGRDFGRLIEWLTEKKRRRSPLESEGLREIDNVIEEFTPHYSPKFRVSLRGTLQSMDELRDLRRLASESEKIDTEYQRFETLLDECVAELRRLAQESHHGAA